MFCYLPGHMGAEHHLCHLVMADRIRASSHAAHCKWPRIMRDIPEWSSVLRVCATVKERG